MKVGCSYFLELIHCDGLQALGFIFIARPEFMMVKNMDKILETTLNASADSRIKVGLLDSHTFFRLFFLIIIQLVM